MSTEPTPGPWRVWAKPGESPKVGPSSNCTVASIYYPPFGSAEANARLIAAAPDLLDSLRELVKAFVDSDEEGLIEHAEPMQQARAAIAKATRLP